MAKCPLKVCDEPWEDHDNIKKIVHSEKAERQDPPKMPGRPMGCKCPVFFPDYCPVHGG